MKKNQSIVVMLDIRGTLDNMTADKVIYFLELLDIIKIFYKANTIKLFFSSFDKNPDGIREYFNIMKDLYPVNVEIGMSYYRYGNYDCLEDKTEYVSDTYNYNKEILLEKNYIDDNVAWFGIFDDKQDAQYVKRFKETRPMAVFRSSLNDESDFENDNMMCYTTSTFGFDGCIENLEKYILTLENYVHEDMVTAQKEALFKLDSEIRYKILHKTRNFDLLIKYIKAGMCNQDDLNTIIRFIATDAKTASKDDLEKFNQIIELILPIINWNYNYNRSYYSQLVLELRNRGF